MPGSSTSTSTLIDGVVINSVDVTAYVNERDPWYPLRAMLRPADPDGMRAAWAALEAEWATTTARAHALPERLLHESVGGEWSFVQTLRHLVFAIDKWFTAPILAEPFHPIGIPNSGSVDFPWPGHEYGRRALVGSTDANRPIIEDSYLRLLDLLTASLQERMFLLGDRPGRGDFGVFGQLRQLVGWDPESARIAVARAPRVVTWVDMVDDLSWWTCDGDDEWDGSDDIPATSVALLHEIGRTYAPFMIANAEALQSRAEEMVCEIDGQEYRQGPFPYQGKCLAWLCEQYAA